MSKIFEKLVKNLLNAFIRSFKSSLEKTSQRKDGTQKSVTGKPGASSAKQNSALVSRYPVEKLGLPKFAFEPVADGDPDPGEVVWAWIPYEEDSSKGKDRPVAVLARVPGKNWVVVAQLSSKNHDEDRQQEASQGRYWHRLGSGDWDKAGRESWARIDRLLWFANEEVRREGASMNGNQFLALAKAISKFHS